MIAGVRVSAASAMHAWSPIRTDHGTKTIAIQQHVCADLSLGSAKRKVIGPVVRFLLEVAPFRAAG